VKNFRGEHRDDRALLPARDACRFQLSKQAASAGQPGGAHRCLGVIHPCPLCIIAATGGATMNTKLKLKLLELRIPQYAVARQLGQTETRFSRIVCGRIEPTPDECRSIAALLQLNVHELFDQEQRQGGTEIDPAKQRSLVRAKGSRRR